MPDNIKGNEAGQNSHLALHLPHPWNPPPCERRLGSYLCNISAGQMILGRWHNVSVLILVYWVGMLPAVPSSLALRVQ